MKNHVQKSRGFDISLQVPESAEEFDSYMLDGSCLAYANSKAIYGILPKIWNKAGELLENARQVTGEDTDDDGNVTKTYEDDKKYFNRLKAETDAGELASTLNLAAEEVGWDVKATSRTKKPEAMFVQQAEQLASRVASGAISLEDIQASIDNSGVSHTVATTEDGEVDVLDLAAALKSVAMANPLGL